MKIVIAEATSLRDAIEVVVNLVEEGTFEISEEGIKLKAMDPSQISMVSFSMPKDVFSIYEVSEPRKVGVDIDRLSKVLSRGTRGESAELSFEDNRLSIKFLKEKRSRHFKIPLLELSAGVEKEPKIEYKQEVVMSSETMKEILKDAKLISSHITFSLNSKGFFVHVKGDNGEIDEEFGVGTEEIKEVKATSDSRATFPLQYLEDIVKASKSSIDITLHLETDRPLKLSYNVEGAQAVYYLAPRIESI
ncbi:proliferating cell nuclear antigen (pcna) [Candidatus Micrarchaeota archaeon]|nr:proliferating cell nuclear antigen (pcna) [Candidatus Micrarchaeota archaeon]